MKNNNLMSKIMKIIVLIFGLLVAVICMTFHIEGNTVLSGVFIFIISQYVLKMLLEPISRLKEVFGSISALFLHWQHKMYPNAKSPELQAEIRKLSSLLVSRAYAIPFYNYVYKIINLPSREDLLEVSQSLNYIGYCVASDSDKDKDVYTLEKMDQNMRKIGKILKMPVSYTDSI